MLDIGWPELLVVAIVLIIVVGPKDLPQMLRAFGRTTKKLRGMASEFRGQFDEALREADLDDVKKSFDDARKLNPMQSIRDAVNPLKDTARDIRSDLEKSVNAKSSTGTPAKVDVPEPSMKLDDGPPKVEAWKPAFSKQASTDKAASGKAASGEASSKDKAGTGTEPQPDSGTAKSKAKPKAVANPKPAGTKAAAKAPASGSATQKSSAAKPAASAKTASGAATKASSKSGSAAAKPSGSKSAAGNSASTKTAAAKTGATKTGATKTGSGKTATGKTTAKGPARARKPKQNEGSA